MPDYHDGPCRLDVRQGNRRPLPRGQARGRKRRAESSDSDGDGPRVYRTITLDERELAARWYHRVFDDGPPFWTVGVTKPPSTIWESKETKEEPRPDHRCGHVPIKHLIRVACYPHDLCDGIDLMPPIRDESDGSLAGKEIMSRLKEAVRITMERSGCDEASRIPHLRHLQTKLHMEIMGTLGTLYPHVVQKSPHVASKLDEILWHHLCVELNITHKYLENDEYMVPCPELTNEKPTFGHIYKFICTMSARVTNLRLTRAALAHSRQEYGLAVESLFTATREAFVRLSYAELKCHQEYLAFEIQFDRETRFRKDNTGKFSGNRVAPLMNDRPSSPSTDEHRLKYLKRNTMIAQQRFMWAQQNANQRRLDVFTFLQKLRLVDRCLTTKKGTGVGYRHSPWWQFNAEAVVNAVANYYDYQVTYKIQSALDERDELLRGRLADIVATYGTSHLNNTANKVDWKHYSLMQNLYCLHFLNGNHAGFWFT